MGRIESQRRSVGALLKTDNLKTFLRGGNRQAFIITKVKRQNTDYRQHCTKPQALLRSKIASMACDAHLDKRHGQT